MSELISEVRCHCPFCAEPITLVVDYSTGSQAYIEDCQVCCQPMEVTAHEMKLLRFLAERDGRLLSRRQILDGVWGRDYYGTDRTVDNFVSSLRRKLGDTVESTRGITGVAA